MTAYTSTINGNLTADPELRFTPSGVAVANFTVAHTPRTLNDQKEWVDAGETVFVRVTAWRNLAENVAASLKKGNNVIATGATSLETYQAKDGSGTRSSIKMTAEDVSVPLSRQTVSDVQRSSANSNGGGATNNGNRGGSRPAAQSDSPWAGGSDSAGGNSGFADEPPF